jgi:hypothetical protein
MRRDLDCGRYQNEYVVFSTPDVKAKRSEDPISDLKHQYSWGNLANHRKYMHYQTKYVGLHRKLCAKGLGGGSPLIEYSDPSREDRDPILLGGAQDNLPAAHGHTPIRHVLELP